jgi:hypothetical protein
LGLVGQRDDHPPNGSDYWWSGTPGTTWQGNARTIFSALKAAGIRPVLTLRNVDNNNNPAWAQALNPPNSTEDWNEWWEHVFATVYWLNVRNDYRVDDFEIHNEPNNSGQGWAGTEAQYFELVQQTRDAIAYVYTTFLPGRTFHIYAPVTTGGPVRQFARPGWTGRRGGHPAPPTDPDPAASDACG